MHFLCASCNKHSTGLVGHAIGEAEEGTYSTDAYDVLKRYSFEHRQAIVGRSVAKREKEEAEAK